MTEVYKKDTMLILPNKKESRFKKIGSHKNRFESENHTIEKGHTILPKNQLEFQEKADLPEKLNSSKNNFHIISGVFRPFKLAQNKVEGLIKENYPARILPVKIGGMYYIVMESFDSKLDALEFLRKQRLKNKQVWLLDKEI